jgi:creatinine amidohydrolase
VIRLDTLTYPDVKKLLDSGVHSILFPVGTLEAHGRHAPVGTDSFIAEEISWRLGERMELPVAPTLNYGITSGLLPYPGSQRIDKKLYADLIYCIIDDFFEMGFRRVIVMNGHGGNTETLGNVAKELITKDYGKRHVMVIDWWNMDEEALKEVYDQPGGHAALDETAALVAFRPETLKPENRTDNDGWTFTKGVISVPYPTAMLYYSLEGDASPDFDKEKAGRFMDIVLAKLEGIISREIELFDESFGK